MAAVDSSDHRPVSPREFTTTHWSVVLAARDTASAQADAALGELCRTYWYPLYAFVRRLGHSPADAQDLTQGFFAYLLEHHLVARADRQVGRFRSFLLGSVKHFLAHEHERATALKRGGGQPVLSLDQFNPEDRYALEPADAATPETIFDQRWARQQIENALGRLRAEYAASGRGPLFDLLKDYVWGDKNALSLAEIAARLELTEEAVKKSVQRLRQRSATLSAPRSPKPWPLPIRSTRNFDISARPCRECDRLWRSRDPSDSP
jgi:RNA polymerase sigma factor (sigma-70 family)